MDYWVQMSKGFGGPLIMLFSSKHHKFSLGMYFGINLNPIYYFILPSESKFLVDGKISRRSISPDSFHYAVEKAAENYENKRVEFVYCVDTGKHLKKVKRTDTLKKEDSPIKGGLVSILDNQSL